MKLGFICICTGKYIMYLDQFLNGFTKNFTEEEKIFFVYTDNPINETIEKYQNEKNRIIYIEQKQIGWPYDTLYRFKIINNNKSILDEYELDYIYFCNINLSCVSKIDLEEVISKEPGIIASLHPGYYNIIGKNPYDNNPNSTAYIKPKEIYYYRTSKGLRKSIEKSEHGLDFYYQGCLYGGTYNEFMKMSSVLDERIMIDERKNVIAKWHDESHLNKYLKETLPVKTLTPNYVYPQQGVYVNILKFSNDIKIVQLQKNHKFLRKISQTEE